MEAFDAEAPGAKTEDRSIEDELASLNLTLDVEGPGSADWFAWLPPLDAFPWPGGMEARSILPT